MLNLWKELPQKNGQRESNLDLPYLQYQRPSFCASKQIPENTLYQVSTEVLGMVQFDADAFLSKITAVRVEKDNTLVFCFSDGTQSVKRWLDRSRRQSWTPKMKEAARTKELERRSHHEKC